jgi:hypothetical protein
MSVFEATTMIKQVLPADSTLVAEFEVEFSSYEAIKSAVAEHCQNDYITDPVESFEREYKMHEFSDACVFEYRNCVYMIKPMPDAPTKFMLSTHTYWDATELECFKACLRCMLSILCECLAIKYQESVSEAYYDKQFEEYLRLNPDANEVDANEVDANEVDANEVDANEVADANEDNDAWIDKYIEDNRIRSSEPTQASADVELKKIIYDDDDIYVYDGIDIYE